MSKESFNYIENKKGIILSLEKQKIINEVESFGVETNNYIDFKDFGEDFNQLEEIKLNSRVIEGLDEKTMKDIENFVKMFKSYIANPIFTDSFHENHRNLTDPEIFTRSKWEKENLNKISKEGQDYYNSNSLNIGHINSIIGFLDIIEMDIINPEIKNEILKLIEELPTELEERIENNILKYNTLSDNKKIEVIKQIKETLKQVISLLEK